MVKIFKKRTASNETAFRQYKRLVEGGKPGTILDIDVTLTINNRDSIDEQMRNGAVDFDVTELQRIDRVFKEKFTADLDDALMKLKSKDQASDYISAVITDVKAYGNDEPVEKWWFHLIDEKSLDAANEASAKHR